MLTYKGTDKEMKCHGGFQYEIGKEYTDDGAIRCGNKGFHSVEAPMDVLTYFPPIDGNRFFFCEANGVVDKSDEDTKLASSELTLKTEIGLLGLIKAQVEYIFKSSKKKVATKEKENAAAHGDMGHAAAQGDRGHAAAQGDRGHAAAQGDMGHAAAQGYRGHAAAQGYSGHAAAQGYSGHAAAQGDSGHAEVHGENSIASAFGINGRVMGGKIGDLLTLYQWERIDGVYTPISGITVRVDGEKIKTNVWYKLDGAEFVEESEP